MTRPVKISLFTISAIIVLAGIVVCVLRWKAWFGNQPEATYSVPAYPHNIVLTYGEKAVSSRIVSWRADTVVVPSELQLLRWREQDTVIYNAECSLVRSRAGKAAYYRVRLESLAPGNYSYRCCNTDFCSEWYSFFVPDFSAKLRMQKFLVFGDVQDKKGPASDAMFDQAFDKVTSLTTDLAGMVFVGDIIERPTDTFWQIFFSSMDDRTAEVPVIAATGNHEYLKGVKKVLDSRWTYVFGNPQNGPERFLEKSYFIDFPNSRFIVLDTDALQLVSDYTVLQTWLRKVLADRKSVWKIVVMHHPVYTAGKGRNNPNMYLAFSRILENADVVFSGHDHNYMRRTGKEGTPLYILTTSSEKFYEPKDEIDADFHASNLRFYEDMKIYADSIRIDTWNVETDSIYDTILLKKR